MGFLKKTWSLGLGMRVNMGSLVSGSSNCKASTLELFRSPKALISVGVRSKSDLLKVL